MAERVGFINLNENPFAIMKQIDKALESTWLDADTRYDFERKISTRYKNPTGLRALLKEIEQEIRVRKEAYRP